MADKLVMYERKDYGISIKYPSTWEPVPGPPDQGLVSFTRDNTTVLNVQLQDTQQNIPLQRFAGTPTPSLDDFSNFFVEAARNQFMHALDDLQVWNGQLGGRPAKKAQYIVTMEDSVQLKLYQAWILDDDLAYVLTFSSLEAEHDELREQLIEECLTSFTFVSGLARTIMSAVQRLHLRCNDLKTFRIHTPNEWKKKAFSDSTRKLNLHYKGPLSMSRGEKPVLLSLDVCVEPVATELRSGDAYAHRFAQNLRQLLGKDGAGNLQSKALPQLVPTTLGSKPAYEVRFTTSGLKVAVPGETSKVKSRLAQFWIVLALVDELVYTLTFSSTAQIGDERAMPLFERIKDSLVFVTPETKPFVSNILRCENLLYNFRIDYPEHFHIEDIPGVMGLFFQNPEKYPGTFTSHVNIFCRPVPVSETLETTVTQMREQVEQAMSSFKVEVQREITLFGQPSFEAVYSGFPLDEYGRPSSMRVKFIQRMVRYRGNAVAFSFGAEAKSYDRDLPEALACLNSFEFF